MIEGDAEKWLAISGSSGVGLYILGRYVFRWFGKDKLEFTKDRVETDIVTGQYSRIRELESKCGDLINQLLEKTEEVGKLKGQVDALTMKTNMQDLQIKHLNENVHRLEQQIEPLMAMLRAKPENVVDIPTRERK